MRQTKRKAAHEAVEAISYQMPTFKLNGKNLMYFAANRKSCWILSDILWHWSIQERIITTISDR